MKKLFYLFLIVGLAVVSCNKPEEVPLEQNVVFKANTAVKGFKSSVVCDNPVAQYALIEIDGEIKTVDVFYLDGTIYTNTIKLSPGSHEITMFVLKNDNGTPGNTGNDIEVFATPLKDAEFSSFVSEGLPITFSTDAFMKNEVEIDVLCFEEAEITSFGYTWFQIDRIIVREFAFFGDFCTKYYADYTESLYANQLNGLRHDMPAIFKVDVFANDILVASYNNEAWLGEGAPLMVQYPDFVDYVDNFDFVLSILVKVGVGFEYKEFYTWSTVDAGNLPNIGSDNVMDFVLGSCVPDADLVLAPYMNLPASVNLKTGASYNPGSEGTYFDVTLSNIGPGYDIQNGVYGIFCGDLTTTIQLNHTYNPMNVFSSLYPAAIPASFNYIKDDLDNINWLKNNLYRYSTATWRDFQNAVWMITGQLSSTANGGIGVPTALAVQMKNEALAYGDGTLPPVGGWAAVLFISPSATDTNRVVQLIFTLVDP